MSNGSFETRYSRRRGWHVDPVLLKAVMHMIFQCGCKSVLDIGCGGHAKYVEFVRIMGMPAWGFDGTDDMEKISGGLAFTGNLTDENCAHKALEQCTGDDISPMLSMCIEVGEHIPEEFEPVVLRNLAALTKDFLMLSWAVPGQRGRDHVNCRTPEYLVAELSKEGLTYSEDITKECRRLTVGGGWERKLLIFENDRS